MKRIYGVVLPILAGAALTGWFITAGCEGPGNSSGPSLFSSAAQGGDRWTILCRRFEGPEHAQKAEVLAKMLRQVKQLNAKAVRVTSDETGSNIYYGEYRRVGAGKGSDDLVFPPEYQRDITFIRSLSDGMSTPFLTAQPELIKPDQPSAHPEWEATHSKGTYSLLVAVFYNTEGFKQRREVAEQYVTMLREAGFSAYYYHEPVKSFVFVGDFNASDVIKTPEGPKPGPRVEQLIARREDEFRHFTENGYIRKHFEGMGKAVEPLSQVVPMPREDAAK